jgi:hypothetical protein
MSYNLPAGMSTVSIAGGGAGYSGPSGPYATSGSTGLSISDILGTERHQYEGMDLRVTPANGGYIVSVQTKSGVKPELYIINETQDLGQEIGKIITMTCLRKET